MLRPRVAARRRRYGEEDPAAQMASRRAVNLTVHLPRQQKNAANQSEHTKAKQIKANLGARDK